MDSTGGGEIIGIILVFIVSIYFTRWVFDIDIISKNAKYQTNLLKQIARKNGVTEDEISESIGVKVKKVI